MSSEFNILDFAGLSEDHPWELEQPTPTDLRCVIPSDDMPTMDTVTQAIATFIGSTIETEPVDSPESEIPWVTCLRVEGLPTDFLLWAEPLTDSIRESVEIDIGYILSLQTVLHRGDPLTHFANIMRILGGADLNIQNICDLPTGRWFQSDILEQIFVREEIEPPEEVLWISRLVEAPEDVEPEDRWAWVSTFGLNRCGRFELEMLGVPGTYSTESVHIVDGLAALTLETSLPTAGQPLSLGTNLLVSMMPCDKAVAMLQNEMPGKEDRNTATVSIASSDGSNVCPLDALAVLQQGDSAVSRTLRSTERSAKLAQDTWSLLLRAANQIGQNEHAGCLVQVPWLQVNKEDAPREYLWFRVVEVNGESVVGSLAHRPDIVTTLSEGQQETIVKQDITDWVLMTPVGPMSPSDADAITEFLTQFSS